MLKSDAIRILKQELDPDMLADILTEFGPRIEDDYELFQFALMVALIRHLKK